ncbi:MAG: YtfJ family protein [Polyangiaceae bacterium]
MGATIYCDWDGAFRQTYGLPAGTSSIVLLGRDGKVLFAGQGALPSASRREVLRLLRAQVGE